MSNQEEIRDMTLKEVGRYLQKYCLPNIYKTEYLLPAQIIEALKQGVMPVNICSHCGGFSLVKEGKGSHCLQCSRDFGATGRRFISEQREKERGCYPNGTSKVCNRGSVGAGANSGTRLGRS